MDTAAGTRASRRPHVLLGITGSVAAVKWTALVNELRLFAEVRVVATRSALHFRDLSASYDPHAWVRAHTHTHAHTGTQAHTDAQTDAHTHARADAHTGTHPHTEAHTGTHTGAHTHTDPHTHTPAHTRTETHKHTHTHTDTHTHTPEHTHPHTETHTVAQPATQVDAHSHAAARSHAHAHTRSDSTGTQTHVWTHETVRPHAHTASDTGLCLGSATKPSEPAIDAAAAGSAHGAVGGHTHCPECHVQVLTDEDEWRSYKSVHADPVLHIELRKWADILLIAPLSANTLAKLANGISDNLLTCVARAWEFDAATSRPMKPVLCAPAMNTAMWTHPFTARHLAVLRDLGFAIVPPVSKVLACGDTGTGAMANVADIVSAARIALEERRSSTGAAAGAVS